jgi:ParB/RepB/Spo0J family partition protein
LLPTTPDLLMPLNLFSPSPTNPRTRMSDAELEHLAESIEVHQVMQPILARPKPNALDGEPPFEIVAGHRRWRACRRLAAAGRNPHGDSIPALRRELSDAQVLAMQLVENIQREDLHPLDEAEHYRRMREDPASPASVEDIAGVGKVSESRVYERLSLLHLVPAARDAFLAEKLSLKTALQVARLPAAHQAEATQHLSDWGGEPMTPKAAAKFIHDRFMLRLAQAPFDVADADLLPEAGACGACPKRTGANPQLFGDITDSDTCTDTTCFAAKKAAQRARLVDQHRVSGYTVLQGDAAREACTLDGRSLKPGLVSVEANVPYALGDASLKVADVLQRAGAPNEDTRVIDHPSNPVLLQAVSTARLEGALRRIKAHRSQLDKAAEKEAKAKAPPPAPAAARQAEPGTSSADEGPAGDAPEADTHEALVRELLAFTPPATSGGKYGHRTASEYAADKRRRAVGIIAAAEVSQAMLKDEAEGLPEHRLAHMLLVLLWWSECYLSLAEACKLCGLVLPAAHKGPSSAVERDLDWLWSLPDAEAERLAMVLLAAQQHDGKSALQHFAPAVCEGMNIPLAPIEVTAEASVKEHMLLGAVAEGTPTSKGSKTPKAGKSPADQKATATKLLPKYRDAKTGETWSGRGLMPKWLKVRMEAGEKLADFLIGTGAAA